MESEKKIIQYQIYKRIYIGKHRQSVWLDCSYSTYRRYPEGARRVKKSELTDEMIENQFPYARSLTDFGAQIGAKWARDWYEKNK